MISHEDPLPVYKFLCIHMSSPSIYIIDLLVVGSEECCKVHGKLSLCHELCEVSIDDAFQDVTDSSLMGGQPQCDTASRRGLTPPS